MPITVTHRAPRQIIAGDSIEFLVAVPVDYQAWTGSARLTGPSQMDSTSVVLEGTDFHVKFSGQSTPGTKTLTPGQYALTVWASSAPDRVTLAQYPLTISADLSTGTPVQQHAMVMLPIIEAAIQARLSGNTDGGLESYTIDGTSVMKMPMPELRALRRSYAAEVAQLQNPNGQIKRVNVTFAPTGAIQDVRRRFGNVPGSGLL